MKIETSYWSAIPVDYDELVKFADEATDEIEKLDKACSEWAEVSQSNYQRAKKAEEEVEKLAIALEALRQLDRRGDSLETFDSVVHEIVSTTLAQLKE